MRKFLPVQTIIENFWLFIKKATTIRQLAAEMY
jgi:hypothetical protein